MGGADDTYCRRRGRMRRATKVFGCYTGFGSGRAKGNGQPQRGMEPGNRRFGTLILVDAIRVESVAACSGPVVGDRLLEVVAAKEPFEAAACVVAPALLPGQSIDFEERIHHVL